MKTRALSTSAIAAAATLALALAPATAATGASGVTDSFGSAGGLSSREAIGRADLPALPSATQRKAARAAVAPDLLTRFYVRGYQTLYDSYSSVLGDVDVTDAASDLCILSNMKVNGSDREDPAITYAGAYDPANPGMSGGPDVPATYGAATYQFGPHYFFTRGTDGSCFSDGDTLIGEDDTLSNAVRIRYQSKGVVQYTKSGTSKKVHVLAQRFDKSEKFVGLYSVKLQYRKAGTAKWSTKKTMKLDKTGRSDYRFSTSKKYYYRVVITQTDNVQSAYSTPRYM